MGSAPPERALFPESLGAQASLHPAKATTPPPLPPPPGAAHSKVVLALRSGWPRTPAALRGGRVGEWSRASKEATGPGILGN